MTTVKNVTEVLEQLAPLTLAEEWDNVGLLIGDGAWPAERIMTCLTVTPETVDEAVESGAQMIVSHHPLPFRPVSSITADTIVGRMLLKLIRSGIAVYSAHTAFDSASAGINQHLAIGLNLQEIKPLRVAATGDADEGAGRWGFVGEPLTLGELAQRAKNFLNIDAARLAGDEQQGITRVAIACGSGGSLLDAAVEAKCDALVTGEMSFHGCLDALARGVGVVLTGHFSSERFAMLSMADYLMDQLATVEVWASRNERDPLRVA